MSRGSATSAEPAWSFLKPAGPAALSLVRLLPAGLDRTGLAGLGPGQASPPALVAAQLSWLVWEPARPICTFESEPNTFQFGF